MAGIAARRTLHALPRPAAPALSRSLFGFPSPFASSSSAPAPDRKGTLKKEGGVWVYREDALMPCVASLIVTSRLVTLTLVDLAATRPRSCTPSSPTSTRTSPSSPSRPRLASCVPHNSHRGRTSACRSHCKRKGGCGPATASGGRWTASSRLARWASRRATSAWLRWRRAVGSRYVVSSAVHSHFVHPARSCSFYVPTNKISLAPNLAGHRERRIHVPPPLDPLVLHAHALRVRLVPPVPRRPLPQLRLHVATTCRCDPERVGQGVGAYGREV